MLPQIDNDDDDYVTIQTGQQMSGFTSRCDVFDMSSAINLLKCHVKQRCAECVWCHTHLVIVILTSVAFAQW
jgi:hypothetical protein